MRSFLEDPAPGIRNRGRVIKPQRECGRREVGCRAVHSGVDSTLFGGVNEPRARTGPVCRAESPS
jgi:hypothetical protein